MGTTTGLAALTSRRGHAFAVGSPVAERPASGDTVLVESMVADDVTRRILACDERGDLVTLCSWCQRVDIDGWQRAPARGHGRGGSLHLTHGICPDCARTARG